MSVVELLELATLLGECLEVELAIVDRGDCARRCYTHHTVRPPEATLRVDKPPLAIHLLEVETTCNLLARAINPTAILVERCRCCVLCEVGLLLCDGLFQLLVGVNLSLPFVVLVLAILVDEWVELLVRELRNIGILLALAWYNLKVRNLPTPLLQCAEAHLLTGEENLLYACEIARIRCDAKCVSVRSVEHIVISIFEEVGLYIRIFEWTREWKFEIALLARLEEVEMTY